ncbi:tartrate dehydrogenase [Bacillus subtilis]|nr:tartrate dehydrogenase [Bacillus subtilis]
MKQFEIAAIPGDGVGKEVVAAAEKVLHTAAEVTRRFVILIHSFSMEL